MTYTVQVLDELTAMLQPQPSHLLDFEFETVTVRELLRRRVFEDCREYNARHSESFRGLVTPDMARIVVTGSRRHRVDPEEQFRKAQDAFGTGGFLMLVGERQVDDLDEVVTLRSGRPLDLTFIRLTPLVGG